MTESYLKTPSTLGFSCNVLPIKPARLLTANDTLDIEICSVQGSTAAAVSSYHRYCLCTKLRFCAEAFLRDNFWGSVPYVGRLKSRTGENKSGDSINKSNNGDVGLDYSINKSGCWSIGLVFSIFGLDYWSAGLVYWGGGLISLKPASVSSFSNFQFEPCINKYYRKLIKKGGLYE